MTDITKERETGTNLGLRGDNLYHSLSMQGGEIAAAAWKTDLVGLHLSYGAIANVPLYCPDYMGQERISYVINQPDKWNPCYHRSVSCVQLPYASITRHYRYTDTFYLSPFRKEPFTGSPIELLDGHFLDSYQAARARAWHTMQPRFEGTISMLNFLWELSEVKGLLKQACKIITRLRSLGYKTPRQPSLSSSLQTAANAVLTYNFGIEPLVRDLSAIWGQIRDNVIDAQVKFKLAGEEPNTRYYSEVLQDNSTLSYGPGNLYYKAYGEQWFTKFTAAMSYSYEYQLRSFHDAFLKYWGLSGSFEAFWNAIPFSFVLDYFIKIGNAIKAMEKDKNVTTEVLRYSESLKTLKCSGTYIFKRLSANTVVINGYETSTGGIVSGYKSKLYNRRITSPFKGLYVPLLATPSDKQKLNLLSLAVTAFK